MRDVDHIQPQEKEIGLSQDAASAFSAAPRERPFRHAESAGTRRSFQDGYRSEASSESPRSASASFEGLPDFVSHFISVKYPSLSAA